MSISHRKKLSGSAHGDQPTADVAAQKRIANLLNLQQKKPSQ
jgi:hypothetical protein